MSRENAEIVRRLIEEFNRTGRFPLEFCHPEMSFVTRGELMGRRERRGHDGMRHVMNEFREAWDEIHTELTEIVEHGDALVAVGKFRLRARSGVELETEEAWAYWFRDGKVTRIEQHGARGAALEAIGLP